MILWSSKLHHSVIFITWSATYPCEIFVSQNVSAIFDMPNHFIMVELHINKNEKSNSLFSLVQRIYIFACLTKIQVLRTIDQTESFMVDKNENHEQ